MASHIRNVSHEGYPIARDPAASPESVPASAHPMDDFVSFPTIPDPEVVGNRSLSTIISKTLRKVTNNASHLVHNYGAPISETDPQPPQELLDSSSLNSYQGNLSLSTPEIFQSAASENAYSGEAAAKIGVNSASGHSKSPSKSSGREEKEAKEVHFGSPSADNLQIPKSPNVGRGFPENDAVSHPRPINLGESQSGHVTSSKGQGLQVPSNPSQFDDISRVTSDNLFLKFSTPSMSKIPVAQVNMNEVTAVNADTSAKISPSGASTARMGSEVNTAGTNTPKTEGVSINSRISSGLPSADSSPHILQKSRSSTVRTLQNRISSIFNNLPNDIEVSDDDDSASDQDQDQGQGQDAEEQDTSSHSLAVSANTGMQFSDLSRENAPPLQIRVSEASTVGRKKGHKKENERDRRLSNNFPMALFDGAKSILQTNLAGAGSSISSLSGRDKTAEKKSEQGQDRIAKRKKQRPHRLSNNPLKNGGIPKKYWMNDSFVSDCLNCFKQFTAFRRKHHCRFCGQIFCADCTTFISYSQYKQQRHGKPSGKVAISFRDKLRVCKPCYSDVVVYLSDDSSSSSDDEAVDQTSKHSSKAVSAIGESHQGDLALSDQVSAQLSTRSRSRSYSASSAKSGSAVAESPSSKSNKTPGFNVLESPSLKAASSPFSETTQKSPEGISHRHPPRMAIPTRRSGEAVEIAIPRGSYTQNSSLKTHQTLRSSGHGEPSSPAVGSELQDAKNWYRNYPRRSASVSSDVGNIKGLENISSFYNSVVNGKYVRLPAKARLDFSKKSNKNVELVQNTEAEPEEDPESENEDEKVMSLYSSLNHLAATSSMPTRPLDHLSTSVSGVPTLLEFPGIEGKYLPSKMNQTGAPKSFDFKPIDSFASSSITENKQRSKFRSNERAKASLRRIKDRRNIRSVKKGNGAPVLPSIDANSGNTPVEFSGSSGISTQKTGRPYPSEEDSFSRIISNSSVSPHKELKSNLSSLSIRSDDRKSYTESPQISIYDRADLSNDILHASALNSTDFVETPEPSLHIMFDERLKQMIRQCLEDCDIKGERDQARWVDILSKTFASIHQIKVSDTLDVKQYIKIKKILGGRPEDTTVMKGLFITKDIDSKKMQSVIDKPKIALLVFPLEYLKQKEQFISLRVVNSQQSVYISNLVSRLISLEPDIVVVGDTVCGLAEKLLEEASITVLSNVKPQVIERISRYTKADIFQSVNDLFFKKGSLGRCDRFEVKKFLFEDLVKTYSFFVGSEVDLGFTICLRGGDEEYLSSVKYASETLIAGAFNSRFERNFFKDFSLRFENVSVSKGGTELQNLERRMDLDSHDPEDPKTICVNSMNHYGVFNYMKLFHQRTLSISPTVSYPLPSILSNVVKAFDLFVEFYDLDTKIQRLFEMDTIDPAWLQKLRFDFNNERFNGQNDFLTFLKFVSTEWVQFYQREFNFRMRLWSNSMKYSVYQLYPIFHRSIHFLHSRVSIRHATPCYGPVVVVVDYYSDNDKCLGTFLDQTLLEANKPCDECEDLLSDHYKTYVHGNFKIDLIVEKIEDVEISDQLKDSNRRLMWSYCPECHSSSPISQMSDETYYLSLGKFFELNFWSDLTWCEGHCEHDFFKSHVKFFGISGKFIRCEISKIATYEVVVPRKKLEFIPTFNIESKLESLEKIQESSAKFFQSIMTRLNRIKVDTFDKGEAGHQKIEELKERVRDEEDFISVKTLQIYENTAPTNFMSLNVIQRDIQELGVTWDKVFNDFGRQFLPTENEITKITQFHLRHFLMENLGSDLKADEANEESLVLENEENLVLENEENPVLEKEPALETSPTIEEDSGPSRLPETSERKSINEELFSTGSRRIPSAIIEDRIMQIRQSFEEDSSRHTTKTPTKSRAGSETDMNSTDSGNQGPKRVQDLTNYFNQMTLEFQKQREAVLERQSSKYKAIPIVNSSPIVEIYDNIEDVVDVDRKFPATSRVSSIPEKSSDLDHTRSNDRQYQSKLSLPSGVHQRKVSSSSDHMKDTKDGKPRTEIPQPEKNSILKSLSNFWADRSATLWDPLEYPLDFTEHTFADSEVIVREDEPCSLVAFCLSTNDYKQKIKGMGSNDVDPEVRASETMDTSEQFQKKSEHFAKLERKFKKRTDQKNETSELEVILGKTKSSHLKYQFVDGSTEMLCKIFYSEQFDALRKACGVDESFVQSLSRCVKWNSAGGKSGSSFLKTLDNRYIIKELSKSELESFVSIAPFYFKYISQSTFNTLTTALAKIFGFYQVEFKNSMNGKTFKMDFLIMENLFYNRKTTRIFDLKGSMRNRHVKQTGKENEVLLDENMVEYIYESPVFVKEQSKKLLRGSLFNDTSFLSAMDVMDYSLVIGIDDVSGKLYVGIIDWLRTFTWDKKVENWVKGVGKKGKDPTIVTPKQYRTRFREAMDRYILEVPDIWYEGTS